MNYPLSIKVPSIAAVLLVLCATASRGADVTSVSYRGSTFVLSRAYEDVSHSIHGFRLRLKAQIST